MAKLSVIVPVYNVERYLRQCLDSILGQTFSDIELIVVDDGSTDQSGRICDEYAEKDSRIVVIHKNNGGLADARNAGLDVISSEYVGFVDSDDWIRPQMYEMLLSCQEKTNAEIVACRIHFFSDDGKINEVWPQTELDYIYSRSDFINHFFPDIKRSIMPSVCNKIFKKSVFEAIRFPLGRRYEDAYIQLDIYDTAKKIAVINEPLYEYRKRSGSITDQVSYEYYLDQLAFSVRHLLFFEADGLKQQCEYALAQVVKHYLIAYFAQKYGQSKWKAELQPYSQLISKYFTQVIKNPQMCRLHKLVFMISRIFPSCAVGICQTYFPECLPEFLRKQPERVN